MVPIHNNNVQVNIIAFESGNGKEIKYRNGHIGISKKETNLTKDKLRNKLLLSLINKLKQTNRKGLLLSDRVDHLKYIYSQLNCPDYSEIVTGKYCTDERKGKQLEFPKLLTLSTFHLFSEAIDFGGDFIILATPKSNIEQAVGRILRGQKTTYRPAVFDIVDTFSIFGNMRWKRNHFYKQQGFEVIHLNEHVFI
jgi:superfamily II DNA or RNA helicase